ncbi:MAG: phosphopantetheine-binding protein [Opitutales bacterium]|jgi:acyl carrier protein
MVSNEQIHQAVAEALNIDPAMLKGDTELYTLPNFDSVQLLTLMVVLDEIGVVIPAAHVVMLRTFDDILVLQRR